MKPINLRKVAEGKWSELRSVLQQTPDKLAHKELRNPVGRVIGDIVWRARETS